MFHRPALLPALAACAALAAPATAQDNPDVVTYPVAGSFDDAAFGLENAILNKGLVVDHVSHVGEMLSRTAGDVGGDRDLFDAADVYQFCSAVLSRKVMEADPLNVAHCPYGIFLFERDGQVTIGHRRYPDGPMQEVQALLSEIAQEAAATE